MDDVFGVRRFECLRDLTCIVQHRLERERPLRRSALHQLHDEIVRPNIVKAADVRMIQRSYRSRFAIKAIGELFGGYLDCDLAPEPGIERAVNLAHTACTNERDDLVRPQTCSRTERHCG